MIRAVIGLAALAAMALTVPAHAAEIDFGNLDTSGPSLGNGNPFTDYSEDGFTVSAAPGQYVQAFSTGLNQPATLPGLLTGALNGTQLATLSIVNGRTFYFSSVDLFLDSITLFPSSYSITGYLGTAVQYVVPFTTLRTGLNRYSTGGDMTTIDRLEIATNSPGQLYLDNIAVTAVSAVPEPTTWAMMLVGFGAVGGSMRRRKGRIATGIALA